MTPDNSKEKKKHDTANTQELLIFISSEKNRYRPTQNLVI